ncbi:MAG: hypothetical protein K2X82_23415 [Gemmataceae bacterium]|nr:hypothetical protein [Gemmataceae bacterium]
MGYYMRFYDTDPRPLRIGHIRAGLRWLDPQYAVEPGGRGCGTLTHAGEEYGDIEINGPRSDTFREEREEMLAELVGTRGRQRKQVEGVLRSAVRVVAVQVLYGGRRLEDTLLRLDDLWDWLFDSRDGGLLQADGEGYYDGQRLILKVR